MVIIETAETRKKQLRWQCRRGMLEIDLLLNHYLSEGYVDSSEADKTLFEELLTENDQQLFLWFTGKEQILPKYKDLLAEMLKKRLK